LTLGNTATMLRVSLPNFGQLLHCINNDMH
jgi:hypothetical protein